MTPDNGREDLEGRKLWESLQEKEARPVEDIIPGGDEDVQKRSTAS